MSNITAVRESKHWSAEAKEEIRSLWLAGDSASVIAAKVGTHSRSAIIGLVHRMGLSNLRRATATRMYRGRRQRCGKANDRAYVAPPKPKQKKRAVGLGIRAPTPAKIDAARAEYEAIKRRIAAMPTPATAKPLTVTKKGEQEIGDDECRWPFGDGPYVFCGCKKVAGASYCQDHLILSKDSRGLAKANPHASSARININPFGLEELSKEHAVA